jgi:hypothetical protein
MYSLQLIKDAVKNKNLWLIIGFGFVMTPMVMGLSRVTNFSGETAQEMICGIKPVEKFR